MEYRRLWCETCGEKTKAERRPVNHILHLLLTLCTCGFWLPVWVLIAASSRPWTCSECGSRAGALPAWLRASFTAFLFLVLFALAGVAYSAYSTMSFR